LNIYAGTGVGEEVNFFGVRVESESKNSDSDHLCFSFELEVGGVWILPLLLRYCVSKIDSWSWCDSWL